MGAQLRCAETISFSINSACQIEVRVLLALLGIGKIVDNSHV